MRRTLVRSVVGGMCVAGWLALGAVSSDAALTLPGLFSDHMVLQCDTQVRVWGTAAAGETVTVEFAGQKATAVADAAGKWMAKLDPMPASAEGRTMTIAGSSGTDKLQIQDVLVGEVWLGSGQSNMAGGAGGYAKGDAVLAKAIAGAPYPQLRLFSRKWQVAVSSNITGFSALHFSFGWRLQQELGTPVGLMVGAVGGTPSGRWITEAMFNANPACVAGFKKGAAEYSPEKAQKQYEQALAKWPKDAAAAKQAGKPEPRKPVLQAAPDLKILLGDLYRAHVEPLVPYTIRGVLWDQGESGTKVPGVDQYTLMGALIRGWRGAWGPGSASGPGGVSGDFPFIYVQKPSGDGCAWDYADPITRMAEKFVGQLPTNAPALEAGAYRDNHIRIARYPNTFMVTSSDLGSGIHPVNKSGYGARASRVALGAVYGKKVEIYGPVYASSKVEGDKMRIAFTHVGQGLAFRNGDRLQGFCIAGVDKVFKWADAAIEDDTVVVSSKEVPQPVAVRYAWSQSHRWANLFNKDGLPAQAFRTDE